MERELLFTTALNLTRDELEQERKFMSMEYGTEFTEEEIIRDLLEIKSCDYQTIMERNDFEDIVLIGKLGLWTGETVGVKFVESNSELRNLFSDYDEVEFKREKNKLFVYLHHHDGTHELEVLRLNKKGITRILGLKDKYIDVERVILSEVEKFKKNYTKNFFKNRFQFLIWFSQFFNRELFKNLKSGGTDNGNKNFYRYL